MLEHSKTELNGRDGRMPAMAPLANPYVPFQLNEPPKYNSNEAIIRGTLFPGLDLPFMGRVNKNNLPNTPLTQLQILSFAIQELALYLDTHNDDIEALELYRQYQREYNDSCKKYEQMYGPLNHMVAGQGGYKWLDDPWPWEYTMNREV